MGVAAGTVKHPQATFDYSFRVIKSTKVDYIKPMNYDRTVMNATNLLLKTFETM